MMEVLTEFETACDLLVCPTYDQGKWTFNCCKKVIPWDKPGELPNMNCECFDVYACVRETEYGSYTHLINRDRDGKACDFKYRDSGFNDRSAKTEFRQIGQFLNGKWEILGTSFVDEGITVEDLKQISDTVMVKTPSMWSYQRRRKEYRRNKTWDLQWKADTIDKINETVSNLNIPIDHNMLALIQEQGMEREFIDRTYLQVFNAAVAAKHAIPIIVEHMRGAGQELML